MQTPGRVEDLLLSARGILYCRLTLSKSQYWPVARLEDQEFRLCQDLLIEAYENVEFYHDLFWQNGFDPYKSFQTLEDLERIPILTKEQARREQSRLVNPNAVRRAMEYRTSGSTGDFFRGYFSKRHWVVEQGVTWRHWSWLGYRFRDRMAIIRSYVPKPGEPLWRLERTRNFLYFSAYHLSLENAAQYLRKLQEWWPCVLRGYPSSLYILAAMAEQLGMEIPPLKGILTASETLLPHYRETIERAFHAKVFDWYGQAECSIIATECEKHEGMHLNPEYGICELIPDASLPPNERRIVGTCLNNTAMPLIRYDTGDIAIVDEDARPCSCGRTLPLIKGIRGRADDLLYTPDGRIIPSVNLYTVMYHYENVVAFQFIQERLDALEVRIKTRDLAAVTRERLHADLQQRFGDQVQIVIRENVEFEQTREGKKLVIISKAKPSHGKR